MAKAHWLQLKLRRWHQNLIYIYKRWHTCLAFPFSLSPHHAATPAHLSSNLTSDMSNFSCSHCAISFSTKTNRDSHSLKCLGSIEVEFPSGKITVLNTETGFQCQCSSTLCKKYYASAKTLKQHIKRAIAKDNAVWIHTTGESSQPLKVNVTVNYTIQN